MSHKMGVSVPGMRFLIGAETLEPCVPLRALDSAAFKYGTVLAGPQRLLPNRTACVTRLTHRWAIPALRTALEMAFTAVHSELSSVVSSPVPLAFLPCSMTKRVMVTTLVSKVLLSDMVPVSRWNCGFEETLQDLNAAATRNCAWTAVGGVYAAERCGPAVHTERCSDDTIVLQTQGCEQNKESCTSPSPDFCSLRATARHRYEECGHALFLRTIVSVYIPLAHTNFSARCPGFSLWKD